MGNTNIVIEKAEFSVSSSVFGGGLEANADITGSTNITIYDAYFAIPFLNLNNDGGTVFGGGYYQNTVGSTNIVIKDGRFGWVYGGGLRGSVATIADVVIEGGNFEKEVFGGEYTGTVEHTPIYIQGGTFKDRVLGGGRDSSAVVKTTTVRIVGGDFHIVYGGGYYGDVDSSVVNIQNGTVHTIVYGGARASNLGTTIVSIKNVEINEVVGGSYEGSVNSASIIIEGGTFTGGIYGGGSSKNFMVDNAKVTIMGGNFTNIYGGSYQGSVGNTSVIIENGNISGSVVGGGVTSSATTASTSIIINDGKVDGDIYGVGNSSAIISQATPNFSVNPP